MFEVCNMVLFQPASYSNVNPPNRHMWACGFLTLRMAQMSMKIGQGWMHGLRACWNSNRQETMFEEMFHMFRCADRSSRVLRCVYRKQQPKVLTLVDGEELLDAPEALDAASRVQPRFGAAWAWAEGIQRGCCLRVAAECSSVVVVW